MRRATLFQSDRSTAPIASSSRSRIHRLARAGRLVATSALHGFSERCSPIVVEGSREGVREKRGERPGRFGLGLVVMTLTIRRHKRLHEGQRLGKHLVQPGCPL